MNIYEKLMNIQKELKAPKGQYNSFGKYKYRSCEDILESVKPLLEKYKVTIILTDKLEQIGERYYIRAMAILFDTESDNSIENTAYAREEETKKGMDGSQITGTSSSYARKYALNGLLLIDDTKDADTDEFAKENNKGKTKEEPKEKKITPGQLKVLSKLYTGDNLVKLLELNKIDKLEDMSMEKANEIILKLKKKGEEKNEVNG
ncbi:MAG: ERF family protein [Clostridiales bacterium]|uniref:ERF family protein n=1 Tax=Terrisporobacter sp. TaxID=1965305 RepID=UPI002A561EDA|nr:ERF family protein [Terrisporobacter sp.]MDD7754532.1 ERF family protein [Clostridiales bacterium]MDY4133905.1 ERF family protein [Terrisporobacter sp.]